MLLNDTLKYANGIGLSIQDELREHGEVDFNNLTKDFILPGAEYVSRDKLELGVDDPNIETGLFHTQRDYNIYLKSQGLGGGSHGALLDWLQAEAPGMGSEENEQFIQQAYETGDPVVDKGDGWYSLVYSGDGTNNRESARVYPSDFKLNDNGSVGMRSDIPGAYLKPGDDTWYAPIDKADFDEWREDAIKENPRIGRVDEYDVRVLRLYAEDAAEQRREVEFYPDRRDPSQINQTLLQGMYEKEAAKQAGQDLSATDQQLNPNVSATNDMSESMTPVLKSLGLGAVTSNIIQIAQEVMQKLKQALEKQFGDSGATSPDNDTSVYQAADVQRDKVDTSTLDTSRAIQQENGYTIA